MIARADLLTETLQVPVGDGVMDAYFARPRARTAPGAVVVAHELFGVTAHVRDVCERLAADGLTALAPDLYHRTEARIELPHDETGRLRGFAQLERLRREDALADTRAAIDHLRSGGATKVGILGLSVGGHVAYLAATAHRFDAVAALYPGWLTNTDIPLSRPTPTIDATTSIRARVLILCGAADHAVPLADLRQVKQALTAAKVEHGVVIYPNTPHGFLCDRRDTYRAGPADDAWGRIRDLFDATLR